MAVKTEFLEHPVSLQPTHLPIIFHTECPKCGEVASVDFFERELYNHPINQPYDLKCCHSADSECDHVWTVKVVLKVGLFKVAPAVYKGWGHYSNKINVVKALRASTGCSLLDAKKWAEKIPQQIGEDLAEILEYAGAVIEWK